MGLKSKIKKFIGIATLCPLIKRSQWYKEMFVDADHKTYPDNVWYRTHDDRNFDIVTLGSSGAKWAFDFEGTAIKGMNWANQPQTLLEDYNLLRCYHSILRKGGTVIITIMPFSGLNKSTGIMDAMKYLMIDTQGEPVQPHLYKKALLYKELPILFKMPAIKALLKYLLGRERKCDKYACAMMDNNPMTNNQLEADALNWINGWKRQFTISDFEAPLTPQNHEGRNYRINLMRTLLDFCAERGYRPVYVIPPVTKHLAQYYTPKFEQTYIYGFLKEVDREVLTLDYSKEDTFQKDELYFNSFFLNREGRRLFTNQVLKDLNYICES